MIRIIGPQRLLELGSLVLKNCTFPSMKTGSKEEKSKNSLDLQKAEFAICLFDQAFKQPDKSIGTKVEINEFKDKIIEYLFWNGSQFIVMNKPNIQSNLPSYAEYLELDESKKSKVIVKDYLTCEFFDHVRDEKMHAHKCKNENNKTGRCGYSSEEVKLCPLVGKMITVKIPTEEVNL